MSHADQLQSVREAIGLLREADDCAEYKVRVHQQWGSDPLVASAIDLPHWLVEAGLRAMERELMALPMADDLCDAYGVPRGSKRAEVANG